MDVVNLKVGRKTKCPGRLRAEFRPGKRICSRNSSRVEQAFIQREFRLHEDSFVRRLQTAYPLGHPSTANVIELHFLQESTRMHGANPRRVLPCLQPSMANTHTTASWTTMLVMYACAGAKRVKSESVTMSCKSKTSIFISSYYSRFNNCYVVGYK